jgi:hypothetical protein
MKTRASAFFLVTRGYRVRANLEEYSDRPLRRDDAAYVVALHRSPHAAPFMHCPVEVTAANVNARRLYESEGLVHEGTYRDGYRSGAGAYEDLAHYGILKAEWSRLRRMS